MQKLSSGRNTMTFSGVSKERKRNWEWENNSSVHLNKICE